MGKCHSKPKHPHPHPDITVELEKTLQQCLNERGEFKEKYEESTRNYGNTKKVLEKSILTVKSLQKQLKLSKDNEASSYRRYAIESDLNKRLKLSQKTSPENDTNDTFSWKPTVNTSCDISERLDDFERRLLNIELILKDRSNSETSLV